MKLIIDIDENVFTRLFDNGTEGISVEDRIEVGKAIRKGTPVSTEGDLISREALKKALKEIFDTVEVVLFDDIIATIDNAPTVEVGYLTNCANCERVEKIRANARPQGEWVRKEDVIHLLERWSDGYSYIEIPTNDAINAIKEMGGGADNE